VNDRPVGLSRSTAVGLAKAVAFRPGLWWSLLGVLWRLATPGWWRTGSRLPLPDDRLWGFRMITAYGSASAVPCPQDLVSYLEWCRATAPFRRPRQHPPKNGGGSHRVAAGKPG
jgi:hypothetical protein